LAPCADMFLIAHGNRFGLAPMVDALIVANEPPL
jgi:hypothetical protein